MKQKKWLMYSFACLLLVGCNYCPGVWSDAPQTFTFTLDKYEVRAGDEITVDTENVKVFDEKFKLCREIYKEKETSDGNDEIFVYIFTMIEKISATRAVFEVPEDENITTGTLIIRTDFRQKEEYSCEDGVWYVKGESDKKLAITK